MITKFEIFENVSDEDIVNVKTKLMDSIVFGNEKIFNICIKSFYKPGIPIDFTDEYDRTPLVMAAYYDREEMLKKLLKLGADPNYQCEDSGETALMIAAEANLLNIITLLIESGADWNIKSNTENRDRDFVYYLSNDIKEIIIEQYPEKYKDYLMKNDADKYNL